MTPLARLRQEPYRLLFPLGTVCAAIGLSLWVGFWLRPAIGYPGPAHTMIMMHGFAGSFIIGFLLTMLPRALGVAIAGTGHLLVASLAILGGVVAAYLNQPAWAWAAHLFALAVPATFAATRLGARASPPPATFACVAAGGLAAIAGSGLALVGALAGSGLPPWLGALGRALDLQAFPLLMILGIGSFLVPKLSGPSGGRIPTGGVLLNSLLAVVVLASFVLEYAPCNHDALVRARIAYGLRGAVFMFFVLRRVLPARLHAEAPSYLRSIPVSLTAMAIGLVLPALWPAHTLSWMHLVYVGGVLWLTLTVASRVLIGHAPMRPAPHGATVIAYGVLFAAATALRIITGIWPGASYVMHLAFASLVALGGIAVWTSILIPRFWSFPPSR